MKQSDRKILFTLRGGDFACRNLVMRRGMLIARQRRMRRTSLLFNGFAVAGATLLGAGQDGIVNGFARSYLDFSYSAAVLARAGGAALLALLTGLKSASAGVFEAVHTARRCPAGAARAAA
jgi:hypothetical protein